jgi:CheY-like chemotaxis protein
MPKILVIEDEPQMRKNILTILVMEGFDALGAENGRLGLEMIQTHQPDLILCDVMMPDLDGYAVLKALRADPATAEIPFVFLTAKGERGDFRAGMNLGADDYLTKPVVLDDLLKAIHVRLKTS